MCLRKFFAPDPAPAPTVNRTTQVLASPDVADGQSAPITGARRLKTAGTLAGAGQKKVSGTDALRISLSLPTDTGLNVPS